LSRIDKTLTGVIARRKATDFGPDAMPAKILRDPLRQP
jgi:hypothetical protein